MKLVSQHKKIVLFLIAVIYIILCKNFEEVAYTLWVTVGVVIMFCCLYLVEKPNIWRLLIELVGGNDYGADSEAINKLKVDLSINGRMSMIVVSLLKYILMFTLCIPMVLAIVLMGLGLSSLPLDSPIFYLTLLGGIPLVYKLYECVKSKKRLVLFVTVVAMGVLTYAFARNSVNYELKLSFMILFFEIGAIVFYENFKNIFPRQITDNMIIKFSLLVKLYPYEIFDYQKRWDERVLEHPRSKTKNDKRIQSNIKTDISSLKFTDIFGSEFKNHSDFFYEQMKIMGYDNKTNKYWPRLFYNELVRKNIARTKANGLCVKDAGRAFQEKFAWINISTFEENRRTSSYTEEQDFIASDIDTILRQLK